MSGERGGLADCVQVIEHGLPDPPPRLSRRVRLVPVSVDVDGDTAAVVFARRGVSGRPEVDVRLLTRQRGDWRLHGGGGGGPDDPLAPRPPAADLGGYVRELGGPGVLVRDWPVPVPVPRPGGWAQARRLLVSAEVTSLVVRRRGSPARTLAVPTHGQLVVVWRGRRSGPTVQALDAGGQRLARVRLGAPRVGRRLRRSYRGGGPAQDTAYLRLVGRRFRLPF